MAAVTAACASSEIVTQATLAPVDKPRAGSTSAPAAATAPVTTPVIAVTTVGGSTIAATAAAGPDPAASSAAAGGSSVPAGSGVAATLVTLAMSHGPAPTVAPTAPATTGPATTPVTTSPPTAPQSAAPPAAAGAATCVGQSFGRGVDVGTIKLVEKALHATQNGDFDTLMADLRQWVVNGTTILDKKWRQEGFKIDVQQVNYLTFYALGVACQNYTFVAGELTLANAPYKPPVGGCIDHTVPLDASTGGAFPNVDIKVVQQALYSLNAYFGGIGGTPGPKTMTAIYKVIGGGFGPDNPLHELSLDQLAQLQVAC